MTYLEAWFDYKQKQIDMQACIEAALSRQAKSQLNLNEFYLLYYLSAAEGKCLKQVDLPSKLHLSPSAISRMIGKLEAKGCEVIRRTTCPDDKRVSYLTITDYGEEVLAKANQQVEAALACYHDELFP